MLTADSPHLKLYLLLPRAFPNPAYYFNPRVFAAALADDEIRAKFNGASVDAEVEGFQVMLVGQGGTKTLSASGGSEGM